MLVLSRKQNQEIFIGDDIKITVLKMKGNTVRLGIEAPREVNVVRGELPRNAAPQAAGREVVIPRAAADPKPSQGSISEAEYTVVFSNQGETQYSHTDVIPFEAENNEDVGFANSTVDPPKSIRFRGNLPNAFQHNRLKEIVSKLTASNDASKS
ncbi:MAG: carbon storage regulator CsrA [Mariniblastus sp.]|jgi:carbon storage regulator CsrA